MCNNKFMEEDFNIGDSIAGTVSGGCSKGVFIELENGQVAFAKFGWIDPGTKVLCTVVKKAFESWRMLVTIDAIIDEFSMAA